MMPNNGKVSQADYVEFGYGQVEPNHLSAQRTAQIYAQLPAAPSIAVLEQGQFVKYDYAKHTNGIGEVNFVGAGEWMLVYNEIKLYRENQMDCEFALIADNYQARIYSPYDYLNGTEKTYKARNLNFEKDATIEVNGVSYPIDDVTSDTPDYYEYDWTNDPFEKLGKYSEHKMPAGTAMVPRVFKTNIGDIFTTNMIKETELAVGEILVVGENGILCKTAVEKSETFAGSGDMKWQVVKVYTMPDGQKGVKIMRIA